jgi:hypothetical protein
MLLPRWLFSVAISMSQEIVLVSVVLTFARCQAKEVQKRHASLLDAV